MKWNKIWMVALSLYLIFWGMQLMGWLELDNDIFGIGAIVTGVLILIDR